MEECIICLEIIETNTNNIYLECCNNRVHDNCLQLWISTNIDKNTDINLCIYCKKNNNIITNIINNYKILLPNNNTEIIVINNDNVNDNDDLNTSNNNNNNEIIIAENRFVTKICSFILSLLTFLFFLNISGNLT
tara:strand:- start:14228 stop:14632 length:405 start_codon:yes stop_codon:yes gene_type:complete